MPSPRRALVNLLVFILLATCMCIFTRNVYPQNVGWAVILGHPSVSASVCCSLGEERGCGCWPLAQTEAQQQTHTASPLSHTVTLMHHASPLTWLRHGFCSNSTPAWNCSILLCTLKDAILKICNLVQQFSYDAWNMTLLQFKSSRIHPFNWQLKLLQSLQTK